MDNLEKELSNWYFTIEKTSKTPKKKKIQLLMNISFLKFIFY